MYVRNPVCVALVVAVTVVGTSTTQSDVPSFQGLGDLPGGAFESFARGVSADGSIVAGTSYSGLPEAFIWTQEGGMVGLGHLPGHSYGGAMAISADGAVVVGFERVDWHNGQAFYWTRATGMVGMGDLPGNDVIYSHADDCSADGSVIVGWGSSDMANEAFRWTTSEGMVGLGDLPGGSRISVANGVSGDGDTVVGWAGSQNGTWDAFRWTEDDGMVSLGDLPGGSYYSTAESASEDGSVIAGKSTSDHGIEAFRWTEEGGMVGLGDLPGGDFWSVAWDISADGRIIVGYGKTELEHEAAIWDPDHGMRKLQDVLVYEYDLDLTGWQLQAAYSVSPDGRAIVGYGLNPHGNREAWLAIIPEPSTTLPFCFAALLLQRRRR